MPNNNDPALAAFTAIQLLEPGWAGEINDEELAYITGELHRDLALKRRWGFRPRQKSIPEEAIRRIAVLGDPENRGPNIGLARPRKAHRNERASDLTDTKLEEQPKETPPPQPHLF